MITPLRKRTLKGELYPRDPRIESLLEELSSLSRDKLLERASICVTTFGPGLHPDRVSILFRSGRAVWITMMTGSNGSTRFWASGVLRSLPKPEAWVGQTKSYSRIEIRERVHDRFVELLALDRTSYQERLDYFEVRFDGALASLRRDAQEQVWRAENRSVSLDMDDDTGALLAEVERAAAEHVDPFASFDLDDENFRLHLEAAIESLPSEQRSVIEMLRKGFPIDSKESGVMTISSALGRSEKTIRNYRDRAIAALRAALTDGDVL